jgi:ABC-type Zn uptake system ZnuABC Zn-binding protein ZnuA
MKIAGMIVIIMLIFSISFSFNIVTSIKPLYLITKGVVGNYCNISYIVKPYSNPHTFQLKPSDILKFQKADLIILVGDNFESWTDKISKNYQNKVLILKNTVLHSIITQNPHFWTDPVYSSYAADLIYNKLDKKTQDKVRDSYINFKKGLIQEGKDILKIASEVKNPYFIAVHPAFYYIIKRYGFTVRSLISGGESSISSHKIIELIKYVKAHNLKRIFAVEGLDTRIADPLITSTKLKLIKIDFLANTSDNYLDYLSKLAKSIFLGK